MSNLDKINIALDNAIKSIESRYPKLDSESLTDIKKIYDRLKLARGKTDLKSIRDSLYMYKTVVIPAMIRKEVRKLNTVKSLINAYANITN